MRTDALVIALLLSCGVFSCGEKHPTTRTQAGDHQELEFTLRSEDDVGVGLNYFDVAVREAQGPYTGDDIVAHARPRSGKSDTEAVDLNVERLGDGRFLLLDVPLSTPGEWVISMSGKTRAGWQDTANFEVAVR